MTRDTEVGEMSSIGSGGSVVAETPAGVAVGGEPLVLTVREAAAALRISKDLVYDLIRQGELPALRLGRRVVVPRKALVELVGSG